MPANWREGPREIVTERAERGGFEGAAASGDWRRDRAPSTVSRDASSVPTQWRATAKPITERDPNLLVPFDGKKKTVAAEKPPKKSDDPKPNPFGAARFKTIKDPVLLHSKPVFEEKKPANPSE